MREIKPKTDREAICFRCPHVEKLFGVCNLYKKPAKIYRWYCQNEMNLISKDEMNGTNNYEKSGAMERLAEVREQSHCLLSSPKFRPNKRCQYKLEHLMESQKC